MVIASKIDTSKVLKSTERLFRTSLDFAWSVHISLLIQIRQFTPLEEAVL